MKNHLDALFWEFLDAAFPWFVAKTAIPQEIRISQLQRRPDWGVSLVTPPAEAKKPDEGCEGGDVTFVRIQRAYVIIVHIYIFRF